MPDPLPFPPAHRPARSWTFGQLVDRIEQAIADGRIAVDDCDDVDPTPLLSHDQLAALLRILAPEVYAAPAAAPPPTGTAPGSPDRVGVYAARRRAGVGLYAAADATAHGPHDRGLRIEVVRNGSGVRVVGWEGEPPAEPIRRRRD